LQDNELKEKTKKDGGQGALMDPLSTSLLFEQFLAQRRYLKNVTPSIIEWYQTAFKALQKILGADLPPLTKSALQEFVVAVRQRGVQPVSCNRCRATPTSRH
jgi:hypothetical protein